MFRMKLFIFTIAAGALLSACSMLESKPEKAAPDELFYVYKEDENRTKVTKGFMDKTGKIVVGPFESFEWNGKKYGADDKSQFKLMPFIEGLAGICLYDEVSYDAKGKCGYIDKTGKTVVEPKYLKISYFSEGLAAVSEDGKKYGYIDKTGKMVIEQKFMSLAPFSDGLAIAREDKESAKTGFIDKTGKFVVEPKYDMCYSFSDGFATVKNFDDGKETIIDKTGKGITTLSLSPSESTTYYYKETINYPFYEIDGKYEVDTYNMDTIFSEGLTVPYHNTYQSEQTGYINTKGELEVKLDAKRIGRMRRFSDGFAPVGLEIADKDQFSAILGSEAVKDVYDWVYIDRKGEYKVPLKDSYADARPFAEGLAAVRDRASDSRWGFIDTKFQAATPFCFDKVGEFRAGLAYVWLNNFEGACSQYKAENSYSTSRYIYIDKTGKEIKPQW